MNIGPILTQIEWNCPVLLQASDRTLRLVSLRNHKRKPSNWFFSKHYPLRRKPRSLYDLQLHYLAKNLIFWQIRLQTLNFSEGISPKLSNIECEGHSTMFIVNLGHIKSPFLCFDNACFVFSLHFVVDCSSKLKLSS